MAPSVPPASDAVKGSVQQAAERRSAKEKARACVMFEFLTPMAVIVAVGRRFPPSEKLVDLAIDFQLSPREVAVGSHVAHPTHSDCCDQCIDGGDGEPEACAIDRDLNGP